MTAVRRAWSALSAVELEDDAGYLGGHRQERGVRGVEGVDRGRVGREGGVGVGDEPLLQGGADGHVLGADHVGAGHRAQPAAVSMVVPALMPAGASGVSSAMAASATARSTSP